MKIIKLLLLFLPLFGYSQVDTSYLNGIKLSGFKPDSSNIIVESFSAVTGEYRYINPWMESRYSTETKKGAVKIPVQVMDSGIKVEVFETRDTLYKCPVSNITYFTYDYNVSNRKDVRDCTLDKIVTCRTYRFYIINEEGKKEYLSMDISKNK